MLALAEIIAVCFKPNFLCSGLIVICHTMVHAIMSKRNCMDGEKRP